MNAAEFAQLEEAFDAALAQSEPLRAESVAALRGRSPLAAARLADMLRADAAAAEGAIATLREQAAEIALDGAGDQTIGPYRVLGQLGEGGFGIVYLAQEGPPTQRLVAVKVIKPGMDTHAVLARFNDERQALALMDHAAVVAAIGAGSTAQGRPYVAMPLVPGVAITEFCRQQALGVRERVDLFLQVCRGVQHAHGKGVLHRDLKPGNILVALVDGEPQAKIIDFGLARALADPLTPHTTVTMNGQMVGTPEYMSPEQASGRALDVRADVYALGAILYDLLAARPPFTLEELRASGSDGMRRVIAERAPAPPSRWTGVRVARELDWITLRCLEKEPDRRYATADALAADLERFLRGSRVEAGPAARAYRLWRWAGRNRAAVLAASGVFAALALGAAAATWSALKEREARQSTEHVAEFLRSIFTGLDPVVAQGRDRELLQLTLDQAAARFQSSRVSPDVQARVALILAESYSAIGEYAKAVPYAEQGLSLNRTLWGRADPRSIDALRVCIEALWLRTGLDQLQTVLGPCAELWDLATTVYPVGSRERIENRLTALLAPPVPTPERRDRYLALLAEAERFLGKPDRLTLRVMRRTTKALEDEPQRALDLLMEARRRALAAYGDQDPDVESALGTEAFYISKLRGVGGVVEYLPARIPAAERILGPLAQQVLIAKHNLGSSLLSLGRIAEAEPYVRQASALALRKHGVDSAWGLLTDSDLLILCLSTNRLEEAAQVDARLWRRQPGGPDHAAPEFERIVRLYRQVGNEAQAQRYIVAWRISHAELMPAIEARLGAP